MAGYKLAGGKLVGGIEGSKGGFGMGKEGVGGRRRKRRRESSGTRKSVLKLRGQLATQALRAKGNRGNGR